MLNLDNLWLILLPVAPNPKFRPEQEFMPVINLSGGSRFDEKADKCL